MSERQESFLRKQAWDYFSVHASQRMAIFNFYIVLSSVTATSYFAAFKSDSNLQTTRPMLAGLLCFFAFIFWKLDSRNKLLIKNAERALRHFEAMEKGEEDTKVFTREQSETKTKRPKGWRFLLPWNHHFSYSNCFNMVFLLFFTIGVLGLISRFCHCGFESPGANSGYYSLPTND
jgi:hypothetical protein